MAPSMDGTAAPQPIVTGTVTANVSPIGLAAGSSPTTVSLVNAQVTLRFDKDGNLVTKLPEPQGNGGGDKLPAITIKGASIHLVQEGRPDFRASGIDVSMTDDGQQLKIAGRGTDPTWKAWTLSGEWSRAGGGGSIVLRTDDRVAVNPEMLKAVPFVPAETWDWVVLTGNTTCAVHVTRRPDKTVGYRVELDPRDTRLTVPPIDLTTTDTSGKVVVENGVVTLTDVNGKTAGGTLRVDSKLDFAATPSVLTFDVTAQGLNIPQLPKTWGLPPLDAGQLEGDADLKLVVKDGKVEPWGRGEADIVGGKLLGGTVEGQDHPGRRRRAIPVPQASRRGTPAAARRRPRRRGRAPDADAPGPDPAAAEVRRLRGPDLRRGQPAPQGHRPGGVGQATGSQGPDPHHRSGVARRGRRDPGGRGADPARLPHQGFAHHPEARASGLDARASDGRHRLPRRGAGADEPLRRGAAAGRPGRPAGDVCRHRALRRGPADRPDRRPETRRDPAGGGVQGTTRSWPAPRPGWCPGPRSSPRPARSSAT